MLRRISLTLALLAIAAVFLLVITVMFSAHD
jgi:hypothetical protein